MEANAGGSSEFPMPSEDFIGGCRASKKQKTDTGDDEDISSAHEVLSNDDLLIEILLRLPVVSLFIFNFVSKRWLSLVTTPNFILRRSQIPNLDPPSGLFLQRHKSSLRYDFVPLDSRIPANRSPLNANFNFGSGAGNVEILQSCNGLILCFIRPDKFFVHNPSINQFKMLPPHESSSSISLIEGMKMAFDPRKSPHYNILYAGESHSSIQLQSCSETGKWSFYGGSYPLEWFTCFKHGIYWNGAIHWLDIVNGALHYKLDLDQSFLTTIQTPETLDGKGHHDPKLFESRGCLFLVYKSHTHSRQLNVYEMRNGYSEWSVKYIVDLYDIMRLSTVAWLLSAWWSRVTVRCIVLGEREEDSSLVMEVYGKIVEYKVVSKTTRAIYDFESVRPPNMEHAKFGSFQFIPSFACV